MPIQFNPALGQRIAVSPLLLASHISSYAALCFVAAVDDNDHEQISKNGAKLQLWSNSDGSQWQEHDFIEDTSPSQPESLTPDGRRLSLCLSVVLPRGVSEVEFSYTYRISYPDGRVKWLGEYGQNGTCVVHRQASRIILCDRWSIKDDTTYILDANGHSNSLLNLLGSLSSNYHLEAFDSDGSYLATDSLGSEAVASSCSLLFIVPKHVPDSHILPQSFVVSSSFGNTISLSATGDVSIEKNAKSSLLLQVCDPRTDLRSILEGAVMHSMPGRIRTLSIDGQNGLAVLATSDVHYPMRLIAIRLSSETNMQTTEVELRQRDLEYLFTDPVNRICIYPPFNTGMDSITWGYTPDWPAKHVSIHIGARYILSPEYHLRSQGELWRISLLSDHTIIHVSIRQPDVMLPTPPPSPQVSAEVPRTSKQRASSASHPVISIAKTMVTCVRYWFAAMFFIIAIFFYMLSILRRGRLPKHDKTKEGPKSKKEGETRRSQTATATAEYAGRTLLCRSLSVRVLPGLLAILLRPREGLVNKSTRVLSIRLDGEELSGLVEQKDAGTILLTTLVDKEGDIEITAV